MKNKQCSIPDELLVNRLQSGDKNAMGEIYLRYYMLVFNKCLSFSKDVEDASDLAQDIMLRVMEKIHSFNGHSKFSTWLFSITFNCCIDHKRKNKDKIIQSLDHHVDISDNQHEDKASLWELEKKENCAMKVITEICEEDQKLLILKYHERRTIREIQELFKISASAVKMRLFRARSKAMDRYKHELVA